MRVLVVEDNRNAAQSLAVVLRLYGHDVEVADDGPSGLAAAQANPPDVVFLDIGLPGGMDGWEVARQLRQMTFVRRPSVIAVTGYGNDRDRKRSYEAGVDMHFTKPAEPKRLKSILDRLQQVRAS
jgi:two-component system, OmpR family, response regulator